MVRKSTILTLAMLTGWFTINRSMVAQSKTTVDANGTVHLSRTVPVPDTISPQAQEFLKSQQFASLKSMTFSEQRDALAKFQREFGDHEAKMYPVKIENSSIAGVPVRLIHPVNSTEKSRHRILINFHGGGFVYESGSLTENIPVAHLTNTTVIAVLYRLAPEHPYPAAVDDALAVYRETLKSYAPEDIGIYGTSAGAILAAELCMHLKQLNLPLPAAMGFFSGTADLDNVGDTERLFAIDGFFSELGTVKDFATQTGYVGKHDPRDPGLSPIYGSLSGFPPTLCISGTRDLLLSQTALFQRALLRSGVDARLIVFEAMPHAYWSSADLPESREAFESMAQFFNKRVGQSLKTHSSIH
jgi:epsilon-lactone hydrolase